MDAASPDSPTSPEAKAVPCPAEVDKLQEEVDVWWGAYAGRTMLLAFVLSGLLTIAITAVAWLLGAGHGNSAVRYSAQGIVGALWLALLGCWTYRVLAWNYRLTSRHLFVERGFGHPGRPGIPLTRITEVRVEQTPWERIVRVGRLVILVRESAESPLVLSGVREPGHMAAMIRKQIKLAEREGPFPPV
jgi:membrane protein YdbS with pleckstrin-like domain